MKTIVILAPRETWGQFDAIYSAEKCSQTFNFLYTADIESLRAHYLDSDKIDILISFGTSVIVPTAILNQTAEYSVNIHSASPEYPGRDPHHFAIYDGAKKYGATLHYMIKEVDAGSIIDVEWFDVTTEHTPKLLLQQANVCSWELIRRFFKWICSGTELPISDYNWSLHKRTRKEFRDLCRIAPDTSEEEVERRIRAFHVESYFNLYTVIGDKRFYYKP